MGSDLTSADNLFRFQSEVIRKLAAEEDCIIMGRCADYVLEGMEGLVRVFIYADMDFREKRTIEKEYYAAKDAKNSLAAFDKLNVLSQNNAGGGGGGSGTDPSQMFETVAVSSSLSKALDALKKKWSDLSNLFAKGFKVGLGDTTSRFATIQKGLQSIKESLADTFFRSASPGCSKYLGK